MYENEDWNWSSFVESSRLAVSKPSLVNFAIMDMYCFAEISGKSLESHSYLTGVATPPAKFERDIQ